MILTLERIGLLKRLLQCGIILFLGAFCNVRIYCSILLITHSYNRPDFIEIQYKTFKKFLQDEHEYVVFNDAKDEDMAKNIENICAKYNIRCIRIAQHLHEIPFADFPTVSPAQNSSMRHAIGIQFSLDTVGYIHNDIVCIVDSDMFLIRPFSIRQYLKDEKVAIAAFMRNINDIDFMWPGLVFLCMPELPNKDELCFHCGIVNGKGVDTGGYTYHYLHQYPHIKVKAIDVIYGYKLFCPYFTAPQHWSSYFPPTRPRRGMDLRQLIEWDWNHRVTDSLSNTVKVKKFRKLGFTNKEIKFLLNKPDTIDFFLHHHFLHYQMGSNWIGSNEQYINNKNHILNQFIEDILRE
ncbi:MAG: hypothetical protein WCE21_03945 [Candidatus Babeliales bacterium]